MCDLTLKLPSSSSGIYGSWRNSEDSKFRSAGRGSFAAERLNIDDNILRSRFFQKHIFRLCIFKPQKREMKTENYHFNEKCKILDGKILQAASKTYANVHAKFSRLIFDKSVSHHGVPSNPIDILVSFEMVFQAL